MHKIVMESKEKLYTEYKFPSEAVVKGVSRCSIHLLTDKSIRLVS